MAVTETNEMQRGVVLRTQRLTASLGDSLAVLVGLPHPCTPQQKRHNHRTAQAWGLPELTSPHVAQAVIPWRESAALYLQPGDSIDVVWVDNELSVCGNKTMHAEIARFEQLQALEMRRTA